MADEESLRQVAQSQARFSVWLGIVILFALFGVIVLAIIAPAPRGDSYEQTPVQKRLDNLTILRDEDAKALTTYAWLAQSKRVARVPLAPHRLHQASRRQQPRLHFQPRPHRPPPAAHFPSAAKRPHDHFNSPVTLWTALTFLSKLLRFPRMCRRAMSNRSNAP